MHVYIYESIVFFCLAAGLKRTGRIWLFLKNAIKMKINVALCNLQMTLYHVLPPNGVAFL